MKAAITGASGFIGQYLVEELLQKGFNVKALVHKTALKIEDSRLEQISGSINSEDSLQLLAEGCDLFFHLAALLGSKGQTKKEFFQINAEAVKKVAAVCVERKIKRLVYFSSAGVYGKCGGVVARKEDDPKNPIDFYEKSKWQAEKLLQQFRPQLDILILRPGWVYGAKDQRTFKLIRQINSGLFFIAGNGRQKHSPILAEDIARLTLQAALKAPPNETYNLATETLTIEEIVQTIASALKVKQKFLKVPLWIVEPAALVSEALFFLLKKEAPLSRAKLAFFKRGKPLNTEKINALLPAEKLTHFSQGMIDTVSWYQKAHWL